MNRSLNIAVVGATGAVGETIVTVLQERDFPVANLYLLASKNSVGKGILFNNHSFAVEDLAQFNFALADIALFSAGSAVSKEYAPKAVEAGCIVIDNTAYFRSDAAIPLIVPEVNPHRIQDYKATGIIANPNCSTIQMVMVLKPLHDAVGIKRVNVATYQAVSGAGKKGIEELLKQIMALLNGKPPQYHVHPKQIAFNVIPHIGKFQANGYTDEEMKMIFETQKIMEDETILVNPTAVRVPVLYGHSEALHLELKAPLSPEKAKKLLNCALNVKIIDNADKMQYPTAIHNAIGQDKVLVGRIRRDLSHPNGLNLWVVADNIRKGAATNAVQIAEILYRNYI